MTLSKSTVLQACNQLIDKKIAELTSGIRDATESVNNDTKSSAGDKFETAREMTTQVIRKLGAQLEIANSQKVLLQNLSRVKIQEQVGNGSLIQTNQGWFFLGVPLGKVLIDDIAVFCLSQAAPLGQELFGRKTGESFSFRGKEYVIESLG